MCMLVYIKDMMHCDKWMIHLETKIGGGVRIKCVSVYLPGMIF